MLAGDRGRRVGDDEGEFGGRFRQRGNGDLVERDIETQRLELVGGTVTSGSGSLVMADDAERGPGRPVTPMLKERGS